MYFKIFLIFGNVKRKLSEKYKKKLPHGCGGEQMNRKNFQNENSCDSFALRHIRVAIFFVKFWQFSFYIAKNAKILEINTKEIKLPRPECYVFYNGDAAYPQEKIMKLSDAFKNVKESSPIKELASEPVTAK